MADQEHRAELEGGRGRATCSQETEVEEEDKQQGRGAGFIGQRGGPLRCREVAVLQVLGRFRWSHHPVDQSETPEDRKSTRLNSSHQITSYAVFCLKKKNSHLSYP